MVETRTLSKYCDSWNSLAVIRCAGRRVINLGRIWLRTPLGMGREQRNELDGDGTLDGVESNFLYVVALLLVWMGDRCGEL
jgi:hypothetical protein